MGPCFTLKSTPKPVGIFGPYRRMEKPYLCGLPHLTKRKANSRRVQRAGRAGWRIRLTSRADSRFTFSRTPEEQIESPSLAEAESCPGGRRPERSYST